MTRPSTFRELTDVEKEARRLVDPAVRELRALGVLGATPVPIEEVIEQEFPLDIRKVENLTFADVRRVADRYKVKIQEEPADTALAGYLLAGRDWGVVFLNREPGNPDRAWRQRFSAGHELGHYLMEARPLLAGEASAPMVAIGCSQVDMGRTEGTLGAAQAAEAQYIHWRNEVLANQFASEILMPHDDVRAFAGSRPICLRAIDEMAERYATSLTASAIRYVKNSDEDCALVFTQEGVQRWFVLSPGLEAYRGRFVLPRRHQVGSRTAMYPLMRGIGRGKDANGTYFAQEWFPNCRADRLRVRENSRYLVGAGGVLSLLWFEGGVEEQLA